MIKKIKRIISTILFYLIELLEVEFNLNFVEDLEKVEKLREMGVKLPDSRSEALDLYLELAEKGVLKFNKK